MEAEAEKEENDMRLVKDMELHGASYMGESGEIRGEFGEIRGETGENRGETGENQGESPVFLGFS